MLSPDGDAVCAYVGTAPGSLTGESIAVALDGVLQSPLYGAPAGGALIVPPAAILVLVEFIGVLLLLFHVVEALVLKP